MVTKHPPKHFSCAKHQQSTTALHAENRCVALEETEGWKAFRSVLICRVCYGKSETGSLDCSVVLGSAAEKSSQIKPGDPSAEEPRKVQEKQESRKQDDNRGVK